MLVEVSVTNEAGDRLLHGVVCLAFTRAFPHRRGKQGREWTGSATNWRFAFLALDLPSHFATAENANRVPLRVSVIGRWRTNGPGYAG